MIKRFPNRNRGGALPFTAGDNRNHIPKTSKSNRQRSAVKNGCERNIGFTLLFFVVSIYVLGTRHIIMVSPSISPSSHKGMINGIFYSTSPHDNEKGNNNNNPRPLLYQRQPRIIGYYYNLADSSSFVGTERLDQVVYDASKSYFARPSMMSKDEVKRQQRLLRSDAYSHRAADTWEDMGKDCVAQYEWQDKLIQTCNHVMEVDMTNFNPMPMFQDNHYNNKHDLPLASSALHSYTQFLAHGEWRDVWRIENLPPNQDQREENVVLKTIRYEHDFTARNFDRHRRDAVAMEQLTSSKYITNIYAACANSGLFEYADGGSLSDSLTLNYHSGKETNGFHPWSSREKLIIANQAASGLADLHNFAKEGVAAISHTDLDSGQFVYVEAAGCFKLNDFNRARLLGKNKTTNELCPYYVGSNNGGFRSPEEYEYGPQTEKVDVYQLGNTFYEILTGDYPFDYADDDEWVRKTVISGKRPNISSSIRNSDDPFDQALLKAIEMCWVHKPEKRSSAREVQTFIISSLKRLGVDA